MRDDIKHSHCVQVKAQIFLVNLVSIVRENSQ